MLRLRERIACVESSAFCALTLFKLMMVARFDWIKTALLVDIMHLGSKYHFVQVSFILNIILGAVCLVTYPPSLQVQLIPLGSWTGRGSI